MNLFTRKCCYCKEDVIDLSKRETYVIIEPKGFAKFLGNIPTLGDFIGTFIQCVEQRTSCKACNRDQKLKTLVKS